MPYLVGMIMTCLYCGHPISRSPSTIYSQVNHVHVWLVLADHLFITATVGLYPSGNYVIHIYTGLHLGFWARGANWAYEKYKGCEGPQREVGGCQTRGVRVHAPPENFGYLGLRSLLNAISAHNYVAKL